jgi:DNA-binding transcriptional LysR family regulator
VIDLLAFRYFVVVADAGSVTGAAARLAITQPALSRRMRQLERNLGVVLFERTPQGHRLTSAGLRVLPVARELVDGARHAREQIDAIVSSRSLSFTVACPEATIRNVVAPFVAATGTRIERVIITLAAEVYERMRDPEIDLVVNTLPPPIDVASILLGRAGLTAQFLPGHRFSGNSVVDIADLVGERIVVLAQGSGLRASVEAALYSIRDRITVAAEPATSDMVQAIASTGAGVCLELVAPQFGLESRPLVDQGVPVTVSVYAAWNRTHFASAELLHIAEGLEAWVGNRLGGR